MKKKHASNLRLLAKLLIERVDPDRFYFATWVGEDWQGAQDLSCGTTGCAVGWAATFPEFRDQGLALQGKELLDWTNDATDPGSPVIVPGLRFLYPEVYDSSEYVRLDRGGPRAAIRAIFGNEAADEKLFVPAGYGLPSSATPAEVAKAITRFVDHYEAEGLED